MSFSGKMTRRAAGMLGAVVVGASLLGACKTDKKDTTPAAGTIVQVAQGDARFSTLVAAVVKTDLATTLSGTGPFTVFAPTNDAFAALPATLPFRNVAEINAIPAGDKRITDLRNVLLYHVLGAKVAAADVKAGAATTLKTRTVGPTGTAIDDNTIYLSRVGTGVRINGKVSVIQADVAASNGVIHAIDQVLLPPSQTIVVLVRSLAAANPAQFTTLLAAVLKAAPAVANTLTNAGDLTVFAPTDAAFAALPQAAAAFRTKASIDAITDQATITLLTNTLLYHVITTGRAFSSDLTNGQTPPTAASTTGMPRTLTVAINGNAVTVKGGGNATAADVTGANVLATNGVVHVINQVLLLPQ